MFESCLIVILRGKYPGICDLELNDILGGGWFFGVR